MWRIERLGDAAVSWADAEHLSKVCEGLQRAWERTRLQVTLSIQAQVAAWREERALEDA
jgi:hypothetical protein